MTTHPTALPSRSPASTALYSAASSQRQPAVGGSAGVARYQHATQVSAGAAVNGVHHQGLTPPRRRQPSAQLPADMRRLHSGGLKLAATPLIWG
jgi:hypothetical protein